MNYLRVYLTFILFINLKDQNFDELKSIQGTKIEPIYHKILILRKIQFQNVGIDVSQHAEFDFDGFKLWGNT